ncbi:MAG TPA: type IV secretory system conjugative DNA transfer family protein [Anaerolineales bacterium]|nr:type IV secretory system conjugative DNA transfer family protein [Anaerolineales bacterium]
MFDLNFFKKVMWPDDPTFPNSRTISHDELLPEGLTMGTLYIGRQGTGKTSSLARHLVEYFKAYPNRAIFVLDWSGSITDNILSLIASDIESEKLIKRLVYDEMGHPEFTLPMPEFSQEYGFKYEEQVQRLSNNLTKLAPELIRDAPFLAGLGLREIAPQIFRVLTSITNEYGESWQVTEAKKLIADPNLLKQGLALYGYKTPEAKWFLERIFLAIRPAERELRSYALTALLGAIEPAEIRARVGFYRPAWTPKEAINKGLMVLVNGARLINQKNTQHYLFTQVYSMIMSEINKRTPGDPNDQPVALVMDEVYSLLSIPGMAEEVGMLSPLYRSRKLELYIVLQALSQLAPTLRQQIWSIGNIVSFSVSNFEESFELAQQLFPYNPATVKLSAKTETQNPVTEPDRGQYLQIANDLQRMQHRECIIRRYRSEKILDKHVLWVKKTKEISNLPAKSTVDELKERLITERGVRIRDALEVINKRKLKVETQSEPPAL